MQTYELELVSQPSKSFRCTKAANSLDIDVSKKLKHHFKVDADITTDYNIGLIVGASGSGKSTLAANLFGKDCFEEILDPKKPVIDQFPASMAYDECVKALTGVGLTQVVCWIRPAATLSNGQKARAECALQMARDKDIIVIDEWTSVVDRTVAKVMSHSIQKHARRTNRRIVLCSCHYDVIEWINPDWIIDCNKQTYQDRRLERRTFKRSEQLSFELYEVGRETWKNFSRYHYLSELLPGGHIMTFGLFSGKNQIGFQCFANYVPHRKDTFKARIMHSNRVVIHPDYAGLGLGIRMTNAASKIVHDQGYQVMAKFSSAPMYLSRKNDPNWKLTNIQRATKTIVGGNMTRKSGFREDVKTYTFKYVPQGEA